MLHVLSYIFVLAMDQKADEKRERTTGMAEAQIEDYTKVNGAAKAKELFPTKAATSIVIQVRLAGQSDFDYAHEISLCMEQSALVRGTGIAKRSPEDLIEKMAQSHAVIATTESGIWVGFGYYHAWEGGKFVANSGLIVAEAYRESGVAKAIKEKLFAIAKKHYPDAKIFGLTTSQAVMQINSELGFRPVTYGRITQDPSFWAGCQSCVNHPILESKNHKICMCTAMLYEPDRQAGTTQKPAAAATGTAMSHWKLAMAERWLRWKHRVRKTTPIFQQSEAKTITIKVV